MGFFAHWRGRKEISMTTTIFTRDTHTEEKFGGNRNLLRVATVATVILIGGVVLLT
jgi:hypothetical protein